MRDEDWRLIADDELQKIAKELVICLEALLMRKSYLFVLSHLIVQVYVH